MSALSRNQRNTILFSLPYVLLLFTAFSVFAESADDPFITFRYAANALAGHGPVFNVGERVEGFTSTLHLLVCMALPENRALRWHPVQSETGFARFWPAVAMADAPIGAAMRPDPQSSGFRAVPCRPEHQFCPRCNERAGNHALRFSAPDDAAPVSK